MTPLTTPRSRMAPTVRVGLGIVLAGLSVAGCPDYAPLAVREDASGGAGGQGGAGGAGSGGMGGTGGAPWTCESLCQAVYDCGLEAPNGTPNCPGFVGGSNEDVFLSTCAVDCASDPWFASLVRGRPDCASMIEGMRDASAVFRKRCDGDGMLPRR